MGVDDGGPGGVLTLRKAVDQHVVDAGLLQGGGERETGGACADDEDVCAGGKHGVIPFVNRC
jgi:hypothetical protein